RRPLAVRLPRAGRPLRLHLLRRDRRHRQRLPPVRHRRRALARRLGAGRAAGDEHPGHQQPAGHRHRPCRREAHPGGADRRPREPDPVRPLRLCRLSRPAAVVVDRRRQRLGAAVVALAAVGYCTGPDHARRRDRHRPEPDTQAHEPAPPALRRIACSGPAAVRVTRLEITPYRIPFAAGFATAHGRATAREGLLLRLATDAGVEGLGEAAPLTEFGGGTAADAAAVLEALTPALTGATLEALLDRCAALSLDRPGVAA